MNRAALPGLSVLLLLASACSKTPAPEAAPEPPAPVAASANAAPPASGALHLGEPISADAVALTAIAAHPADYKGKTIATTGEVTAVCQEMGCWMELKDEQGLAHVRMHGHTFFVPKTAPGHHARIQATVLGAKDADGQECDDEAAQPAGHAVAKIELDATGVELD